MTEKTGCATVKGIENRLIFKNGVKYEFTFNPKIQCETKKAKRLTEVFDQTASVFYNYVKPYASYELFTEIPHKWEFNPGTLARIHYHGWITFTNVVAFMIEKAPYLLKHGTFKFGYWREDYWPIYMLKDKDLMMAYCGSRYKIDQNTVPKAPVLNEDLYVEDKIRRLDIKKSYWQDNQTKGPIYGKDHGKLLDDDDL